MARYIVQAVITDLAFTFAGVRTATRPTGELINEDEIVPGGEESAGMSFKGHDAKKNGIFACLLATQAVATSEASLSEPFGGVPVVVLKRARSAYAPRMVISSVEVEINADGAGQHRGGIGI